MAAIGISAIYLLLFATYLLERSPNVHKTHHKHINFGLNETFASRQPIRAGFEAINRSWLAIEHSVMFGRDSRKKSSRLSYCHCSCSMEILKPIPARNTNIRVESVLRP